MVKSNQKNTLGLFKDHIKEGSQIEYDMEKAHKPLVEALKLIIVDYNSVDLKGLLDDKNPLNPINSCCRELKAFLNSHKSFNRRKLPDYLNLFAFIYNPLEDPMKRSN